MKLEEMRDAIFSCMGCGDCGYSIRSAVKKYKTCPIKEAHDSPFEVYFSRGRMLLAKGVLNGDLKLSKELAKIVYQCTSCGGCHDTCHQSHNPMVEHFITRWIDHIKVWESFREDLINEGYILEEHERILNSLKNPENFNPYEKKALVKKEIIKKIDGFVSKGESDVGFFSGCTYPLQYKNTLENLGAIFSAMNLKISKIPDESCCGSVAFRIGDVSTAKLMIERNKEIFEDYGLKLLISACSGCFRTLKMDYNQDENEKYPKIMHITEYLENKIKKIDISKVFTNDAPITIAYHDPCHLGRHSEIYEAPRNILKNLPGVKLVEMKRYGHNAWCCGAGGGVKSQFPELSLKIAKNRMEEAIETGASLLITSCPFCVRNLSDGNSENSPIKVLDIIDFLKTRL